MEVAAVKSVMPTPILLQTTTTPLIEVEALANDGGSRSTIYGYHDPVLETWHDLLAVARCSLDSGQGHNVALNPFVQEMASAHPTASGNEASEAASRWSSAGNMAGNFHSRSNDKAKHVTQF